MLILMNKKLHYYVKVLMAILLFAVRLAHSAPKEKVSLCVPVVFSQHELICIGSSVGAFSAMDRAAAAVEKIERLSKDNTFNTQSLSVVESDTSSDIVAQDTVILSINNRDAEEGRVDRQTLALHTLKKIQAAIQKNRELNRPQTLLEAAGYTAFSALIFVLLLILIANIYPRLYAKINSYRGTKIRSIKFRGYEILTADRIISAILWLTHSSRLIFTVLLVYFYLPIVLSFFPATENLSSQLIGYTLRPLKEMLSMAIDFVPDLFFILVVGVVTKYILNFVHFIFKEIERGFLQIPGFYREWADPTYKLVRIVILAFALVMAFPYIPGSNSLAFKGISVFMGLLLSLGSSSAISNMVAGIVITYMRPFKVGDRVKIADTIGDIIEKNLLITRIRTIKEVEITIPNSMVLGSHIVNYSTMADSTGLILNTTVTIGYDVAWPKVHDALIKAALKTDKIEQEKKPFVFQTALNDYHVSYELNAYTSHPNEMATIYSELHENIQDTFNEHGIEIMSPSYLSLRDGNEITIPVDFKKNKKAENPS